ncbi:MAG TPA: anti-sigma factor [Gaiellaceae bacterium]|nr:anti-sigma factor [Gaiellaceae bacterium]
MRTNCDQARERLSLQLDDELSAHEAVLLERHLATCPACAAFAADVSESTALLRATPLEPAPPFLLLRRPVATRMASRVAAVAAAAAAAVLVAVSTVSLPGNSGRASAGFGYWPTGLTAHPRGDANLGVQRVGLQPPRSDGPRRGLVSA